MFENKINRGYASHTASVARHKFKTINRDGPFDTEAPEPVLLYLLSFETLSQGLF